MQCTLDTVTQMLEEDPNRTYMQVETAFFSRWWEEQTTEKQNKVKKLVANGQLEFTNGGWCMHDEASPLWCPPPARRSEPVHRML